MEFKLDNHPKIESGFRTPENYFNNFTVNVDTVSELNPKVIPLNSRKTSWMYAAAAVLLLALTIPALNNLLPAEQTEPLAIEEYFASHAQVTNDEIAEHLDTDDIANMMLDLEFEQTDMEEALLNSDVQNLIY